MRLRIVLILLLMAVVAGAAAISEPIAIATGVISANLSATPQKSEKPKALIVDLAQREARERIQQVSLGRW